MARTVAIRLPLPPRDVSPNARPTPFDRAKAVKQARQDAAWAAQEQRHTTPMLKSPVRIDAAFFRCARDVLAIEGRTCPTDPTNAIACAKAYEDGLRDAGLLIDDTAAHVRWGWVDIRRCTHGKGTPPHAWTSGVVLTLSEEE